MSHKSGLDVTLEIERLGYTTARGDTLVEDISFHVHTGEILAIAGPNGAGKSTLVRMIAGLMPAASGEIRLGGRSLNGIPLAERARSIAYVGRVKSRTATVCLRVCGARSLAAPPCA